MAASRPTLAASAARSRDTDRRLKAEFPDSDEVEHRAAQCLSAAEPGIAGEAGSCTHAAGRAAAAQVPL
jgi:hypothetical protein